MALLQVTGFLHSLRMPITSEQLLAQLNEKIGSLCPDGMQPIARHLPVRGFFPGTSGYWPSSPNNSSVGVRFLVLAHDFGTVDDWTCVDRVDGEDPTGATWRNLIKLFEQVNIDPEECFFSNAVIGLRTGKRNTGGSPGTVRAAFRKLWANCLEIQIRAHEPRGLVVLGAPAWRIVVAAHEGAGLPAGFRAFDHPTNRDMVMVRIGGVAVPTVLLLHPALRQANLWRRNPSAEEYEQSLLTKIREATK